jgi:hypothetical protein
MSEARAFSRQGGIWCCRVCAKEKDLGSSDDVVHGGWPRCCGQAMRWMTRLEVAPERLPVSGSSRADSYATPWAPRSLR